MQLFPKFGIASKCRPPPSPVENPGKLKEKSRQKPTRYRVFCSVGYLIQSGQMESCLAAQKRIFKIKGAG
jgi:hypothetical protein